MKRILAFVLLVVLAIVPITAASAYTGNLAETGASFTPRLTAPSKSNAYYYSNKNVFYAAGYGMPNCTAYAWGRAYEILGTKPNLSINSAHRWWSYNKDNGFYPYGSTPKLGAIACWEYSGGGHVAVVEKITSTTVTMSHSAYGGKNFYTTDYAVGAPNGGSQNPNWTFKGYIYILDSTETKPVTPKGDVYRVTSDNGINMRKGAGTSYSVLTAIPYGTEITVTEAKSADGYIWGKTTFSGYTGWCVLKYATLVYDNPNVDTALKTPVTKPTEPETTAPTEPETTAPTEPETTAPTVPETTVPEERPVDWADLTGDGKTTVSDATALQKHLADIETEINLDVADINGDGRVSVLDATYIQKVLADLE